MTNARDKLEEARYFLARLKEAKNLDPFRFDLSAFISACRSITLMMQVESTHKEGFLEWYKAGQEKMSNDGIMKYFYEHRRLAIHIRPLSGFSPISIYENKENPERLISVYFISGTAGTITMQTRSSGYVNPDWADSVRDQLYYFDDFLDKDIVSLSEYYLAQLENLVERYEELFFKNRSE